MATILIIDDEEFIRESLSERVERLNHQAWTASTLDQGITLLEEKKIDLVFLDVNLPDGNGLEALSLIKQTASAPEVIIITAAGNSQGAATAIKNGAWDYITKPFSREEITLHIQRSIDYRHAKETRVIIPMAIDPGGIIGQSNGINKCMGQIAQCAGSDANVLILGETGTGKELVAKAVHDNHISVTGNYIVVDCSAMPETLAESVLFGHVKGAFTGADKASEGLIKQADQGTLFLDEVGELPLAMQKLFLRALQEKKIRPVGSSKELSSKFRLISATNRNLDQMVKKGTFRQDLLHRLKTISIKMPPLRERKEDIQIIAQHYIHRLCKEKSMKTKSLLPETLEVLESYPWPGNVRELINVIEKAIISEPELPILYPMFLPDRLRINFADQKLANLETPLSDDNRETGMPESIFSDLYANDTLPELKPFREATICKIESLYLKTLFSHTCWDLEKATAISGISKSRMYYLIKKYDLKKK